MNLEDIYPARPEDLVKVAQSDEASILRDNERALLENQKSFDKRAADESESPENREVFKNVFAISKRIQETGHGLAFVVGGFARDSVMKSLGYDLEPKDVDIEVYGIEMPELLAILSEFGKVDTIGEKFSILKVIGLDVSIPRRDSKKGEGHKGFEVTGDPSMLLRDGIRRRDLTINSISLNPLTGEIIDPGNGIDDILDKKLRAVDPETFVEDPLRVLRVMQFAGRFDFDVEEGTKEICVGLVRSGALDTLSLERFEEEWKKLLLKSRKPSKGLEVARELEIVSYYPELLAIIGCEQEADWHPEGDVWTHTLMVLDEAKKIAEREKLGDKQALVLLLSALCHDFGKPATTKMMEVRGVERLTAHGHEEAGVEPARKFLKSIHMSDEVIAAVLPLIEHHLFPTTFSEKVSDAAVRRMAKKLSPASIKDLVMLGEADVHGRGIWSDQPNKAETAKEWAGYPSGGLLLASADRIPDISAGSSKVVNYMTGKILIGLGLKPGVRFKAILAELEKAQEEDKISGPDDLRLAKLLAFIELTAEKAEVSEPLLTGEAISKEDMIKEIKERIFDIGTHDMGTLVMHMLLKGEPLPPILERNRAAILTAHKHGPAWFKHFDREFYDTSWKSFYGAFEVDLDKQKELAQLDFEEQLQIGLDLILNPKPELIDKYKESMDIQPVHTSGRLAYYVTDQYPFEAGMMSGYEVMVQFIPEGKKLCVSVMNEDPKVVKEIDGKIRALLPEFEKATKVGYLFASNESGADNVFSEADGERVYEALSKINL